MTPAARLSAAIEVLDDLAASRAPADEVLKAWGRAHRFAGAKDRRAIAERVYAVLRARPRLAYFMGLADSGEAVAQAGARSLVLASLVQLDGLTLAEIEDLFSGEAHAPSALTNDERRRLTTSAGPPPDWVAAGAPPFVAEAFQVQFGDDWMAEAQALIGQRAPLDLRVNSLRGAPAQAVSLLRIEGLTPEPTPHSALGLRLPADIAPDVQRLRAFKTGWVEVQDEASQVAAALAGARPGMTVVDYCAGGGGKTLALGAALRRSGRLVACDVNARRLEAMAPRLARADVTAEVRRLGPDGAGVEDLEAAADLVFVDAPCSGSGTWRRHPEAAWRLYPATVARLAGMQADILARAARLVRPGGRLVYATCSVLAEEDEAVAAAFAAAQDHFAPMPVREAAEAAVAAGALTEAGAAHLVALAGDTHTLLLTPRRAGTDGFFVALFQKRPLPRDLP